MVLLPQNWKVFTAAAGDQCSSAFEIGDSIGEELQPFCLSICFTKYRNMPFQFALFGGTPGGREGKGL